MYQNKLFQGCSYGRISRGPRSKTYQRGPKAKGGWGQGVYQQYTRTSNMKVGRGAAGLGRCTTTFFFPVIVLVTIFTYVRFCPFKRGSVLM